VLFASDLTRRLPADIWKSAQNAAVVPDLRSKSRASAAQVDNFADNSCR
jgi:hypothetical protein